VSGICGIVDLHGAPVDPAEIDRLTAALEFRGPDGRGTRVIGTAALGKTLLVTTPESAAEAGPCTLDGRTWIVADARIDGRGELRRELAGCDCDVAASATDEQLILHAFRAWGEECVEHLIGDFAFAIWDGPCRRLFCVRDHFGVKPFFYALAGNRLVFGNSLRLVQRYCGAAALNELAIADFLLFETNQDPETTIWANVRRLAPGQSLSATSSGVRTRRYWSVPHEPRLEFRSADEHVERFKELLDQAVADRLRTDRAALTLSGGLDSAAVAAMASAIGSRACAPLWLRGCTAVYDRLFRDEERFYSGVVSERLGIPIGYRPVDGYRLYGRYDELDAYLPEPAHDPLAAIGLDLAGDAASHGRVVLTGWDGDGLLNESPGAYFGYLLRHGHLGRFVRGAIGYAISERRLVPGRWLRHLTPWKRQPTRAGEELPAWLNPEFERRLRLRERIAEAGAESAGHPFHPRAFRVFDFMRQSNFFEASDPGRTRCHLEYRHPLIDVRLVEHCLSIPPYPWCLRKEILRRSMRGLLPDSVRMRPKTPLAAFPHHELLRQDDSRWVDRFDASAQTSAFVERAKIPSVCTEDDPHRSWMNLRPLSLELWLRNMTTIH
jgi:asparagine synthase (glutamine-hydrolysing)